MLSMTCRTFSNQRIFSHPWPEVASHPQPPPATPKQVSKCFLHSTRMAMANTWLHRLIYRIQKRSEGYFSGFPYKKCMYSCNRKFCTIKAWINRFIELGCEEAGKSFTINCCPTMTIPKSTINSSQAPRHFAGKMVKHQF